MKPIQILIAAGVAICLTAMAGVAQAASSYELDRVVPDMNHASYWENHLADRNSSVTCSRFNDHSGVIGRQYDAAVVVDGVKVRVYPDLSGTGEFQAVGATNPSNGQTYSAPHSIVMKCFRSPVGTTVPSTTTSSTTSTTVPDPNTPPSTTPETTTTAPRVLVPILAGAADCPNDHTVNVRVTNPNPVDVTVRFHTSAALFAYADVPANDTVAVPLDIIAGAQALIYVRIHETEHPLVTLDLPAEYCDAPPETTAPSTPTTVPDETVPSTTEVQSQAPPTSSPPTTSPPPQSTTTQPAPPPMLPSTGMNLALAVFAGLLTASGVVMSRISRR